MNIHEHTIMMASVSTISRGIARGVSRVRPAGLLRTLLCGLAVLGAVSPAAAQSRFTYDGDEATDSRTGLIWRRCSEGQAWTGATCEGTVALGVWTKALRAAEAEATRTGKGWRLPNVKELQSIVDDERSRPAIDPEAFPGAKAKWYWSSTPYSSLPYYAWSVFFYDGATNFVLSNEKYAVRLVRDPR